MNVRRLRLAIIVTAMVLATAPLRHADAAPARTACGAPDDLAGSVAFLPKVAEAAVPGGHLRVLAVGSATMFGPEASLSPGTLASQALSNSTTPSVPPTQPIEQASDKSFPRQMAKALQDAVPKLDVQVVVRGGRGMSATDMLAQLKKELDASRYQLVLWQTGTVEAVRNTPPGEFAQVLSSGAEAVEAAGANLVLIDPQYSRFLQTNSNLDPYTQALQQTASMPGTLLFRRFDLMRNWANDGQIDLERTPKNDRRRVGELLHACLGSQLARLILAGTRP